MSCRKHGHHPTCVCTDSLYRVVDASGKTIEMRADKMDLNNGQLRLHRNGSLVGTWGHQAWQSCVVVE